MRIDELVKGLNFLGLAYGKEYSQLEAQQVYEFIKEYDYETFIRATKDIIRTSKFLPKIADLIEACEKQKEAKRVEAIDYMKECGYFYLSNRPEQKLDEEHATRNYLKVKTFIERGIIPEWLQEDLKYYYDKMRHSQLESKTNKLLS